MYPLLARSSLTLLVTLSLSGCFESEIYPAQNSEFTFDDCDLSGYQDLATNQITLDSDLKNGDPIRYFSFSPETDISGVVVYFHGNGSTACQFAGVEFLNDVIHRFTAAGIAFILPEYAGYVDNSETDIISQKRVLQNSTETYNQVLTQYPNLPIHIWGRSLGSGISTYLASKVAGPELVSLSLTSPYTRPLDVVSLKEPFNEMPIGLLALLGTGNEYPAYRWANEVTVPTKIFIGMADDFVVPTLSQKQAQNFTQITPDVIEIEEATHRTIMFSEIQRDALLEFIFDNNTL